MNGPARESQLMISRASETVNGARCAMCGASCVLHAALHGSPAKVGGAARHCLLADDSPWPCCDTQLYQAGSKGIILRALWDVSRTRCSACCSFFFLHQSVPCYQAKARSQTRQSDYVYIQPSSRLAFLASCVMGGMERE